MVHSDLKLENIVLTSEFRGSLIDFGLSSKNLHALSTVVGTEKYLSPEMREKFELEKLPQKNGINLRTRAIDGI